jgi:sialic acid synthase SpsE
MFTDLLSGPFIIGEVGVNHNGSLNTALELVEAAVASGCDAVKFQTWRTERVYSPELSTKPKYQLAGTPEDESEFATIRKLELSYDDFRVIKSACDRRGIVFISTPDELESASFLADLGVPFLKVASQDVTNPPLLASFAQLGLPVLLSTGGATFAEVATAVEVVSRWCSDVALLHCVSSYPVPLAQMNLSVIPSLRSAFALPVGLSDHTVDVDAALISVGLGALIFEKHLTLDREAEGPDHQASMNPDQFRDYCERVRVAWRGLGDGKKRVLPIEEDVRAAFRRYLVVNRPLKAGHVLIADDFDFRKTSGGIEPSSLGLVLGSALREDAAEGSPLAWEQIELR